MTGRRSEALAAVLPIDSLELTIHEARPVLLIHLFDDCVAVGVSDEQIEALQGQIQAIQGGQLDPPL